MKKLIPLEDFNKARSEIYRQAKKDKFANGIECPNCHSELIDTDPEFVVSADPPETKVFCTQCGYQGKRIL